MESKTNNIQQEIFEVVKKEVAKLPKGVLVGAAIGGLLVLTRFRGLKAVLGLVGPYVLVDLVSKLLNKDDIQGAPAEAKVVEDVNANVVP